MQHRCKKCNTGAKSVTPVQITHRNSGLWFAERHWESCRPMISCKRQWPKFCTETLKNFFSNAKKRVGWWVIFANISICIGNHTVFRVQFGINLHLWVFQKAEIALAEAAFAISAFWKTHSCKLIPNWTQNRMITYTNRDVREYHPFSWERVTCAWDSKLFYANICKEQRLSARGVSVSERNLLF